MKNWLYDIQFRQNPLSAPSLAVWFPYSFFGIHWHFRVQFVKWFILNMGAAPTVRDLKPAKTHRAASERLFHGQRRRRRRCCRRRYLGARGEFRTKWRPPFLSRFLPRRTDRGGAAAERRVTWFVPPPAVRSSAAAAAAGTVVNLSAAAHVGLARSEVVIVVG